MNTYCIFIDSSTIHCHYCTPFVWCIKLFPHDGAVNVYWFCNSVMVTENRQKNFMCVVSGLLWVVGHMTMPEFKWSDIQCNWWQFNFNQNTEGMLSINIIIVDAILIFVYCRPMSTKHLKSTVHLSNPSWVTVTVFCLLQQPYCLVVIF